MVFENITQAIDWFKSSMASAKNEEEFSQVLIEGLKNKCVKVDETLEALKRISSEQFTNRQREVARGPNSRSYGNTSYPHAQLQTKISPFEKELSQSQHTPPTIHDMISSLL